MPQSATTEIAEFHNLAAHAHTAAAVAHGKGDHLTAHELQQTSARTLHERPQARRRARQGGQKVQQILKRSLADLRRATNSGHHDSGCPTRRGFRRVGTTNLDLASVVLSLHPPRHPPPLNGIFLGLLETRKVGGIEVMAQVKISVRPNGPYRVEAPEGSIELVDVNGNQFDLTGKPAFSLCRCGGSVNKPFCDGTHSRIGFQGAELAVKKAEG